MTPLKKTRLTRQRKIILEELNKLNSHPTANEIYEIVRQYIPNISLGTVYRNLELLSSNGAITKLTMGGSQMRFDGNIDNHYHVKCNVCGKMEDIHIDAANEINSIIGYIKDYLIYQHRLEFYGICSECRMKLESKKSNVSLHEEERQIGT